MLTPLPGSEDYKALWQRGVRMDPNLNKYDLNNRVKQGRTRAAAAPELEALPCPAERPVSRTSMPDAGHLLEVAPRLSRCVRPGSSDVGWSAIVVVFDWLGGELGSARRCSARLSGDGPILCCCRTGAGIDASARTFHEPPEWMLLPACCAGTKEASCLSRDLAPAIGPKQPEMPCYTGRLFTFDS